MAALPKINLKAEVPAEIKAEVEQTKWGKVLSLTPVVLTVVATLLAGLASSEMTRAQYDRSLAAQRQSKAGDQWNFFQGKKLRSLTQRSTFDLLTNTTEVHPVDAATLSSVPAGGGPDTPVGRSTLAILRGGPLPVIGTPLALAPRVEATLAALEQSKPDAEVSALLLRVTEGELDAALHAAQRRADEFDAAQKPLGQTIDAWEKALAKGGASAAQRRDLTAARLDFTARRYDAEARLNQSVATLLELQVRASNLSAERHHRRSGRFFYGMLAGQVGVIVATLALAMQRRNLLWSIAAAAGMVSISFAVYVLVYV